MECYVCGQEGHRRSECPARSAPPAASPPPASAVITPQPPPYSSLPRQDPTPPIPEYLELRAGLGMPTHARHIQVSCPWCRAAVNQQCWNPGTRTHCAPHPSRVELSGDTEYRDAERIALAREQLGEARASHLGPPA